MYFQQMVVVPDYQPINKTYQQVLKIFGFFVGLWIAIMFTITFFDME